jgi:hypothetical protein
LLTKYYRPVRVFDTRARIDAIPFLPGRDYLLFDSHFAVYHRNTDPVVGAGLRDREPIRLVPITVEALISRQTWAGPAYDSGGFIAAHAPSLLTVKIPPGARAITGQFGFFPGAYEKLQDSTQGGIFAVSVVSSSGKKTRICATSLNPREQPADRGSRSFEAAIPAGDAALAEFTTDPLAGKNNGYGWTYWTNLYFEIPGR